MMDFMLEAWVSASIEKSKAGMDAGPGASPGSRERS